MSTINSENGESWLLWLFGHITNFVTLEFVLTKLARSNGGNVILLRSVLIAIFSYSFVVLVLAYFSPELFDERFYVIFIKKIEWLGAIFAASYIGLYARFASQWTYLASLYNQIKQAEVELGDSKESAALASWKAGFVEDSDDLHLAAKPIFASVVRFWMADDNVRARFVEQAPGGEGRARRLCELANAAYERRHFQLLSCQSSGESRRLRKLEASQSKNKPMMDRVEWWDIWCSYRDKASRWALVREIIKAGTALELAFLFVAVFLFFYVLLLFIERPFEWAGVAAAFLELLAILVLARIKSRLFSSSVFTEASFYRSERFRIFQNSLLERGISPENAANYLDVVKNEIELHETEPFYGRRIMALIGSISLITLAALLQTLRADSSDFGFMDAIGMAIIAGILSGLVYIAIVPFRTHVEKLKELQLYLSLYYANGKQQELTGIRRKLKEVRFLRDGKRQGHP